MQEQVPPSGRALKEHSENLRHIPIGVTMHAQSMDEVQNIQTSSIYNSSIQCVIHICHIILESHLQALQLT
jgi:hypothetical protein